MVQVRLSAGPLLGLWLTVAVFRTAAAITSGLGCDAELTTCFGDGDCFSCLATLQSGDVDINFEFTECTQVYADVCALVEDAGCDTTNGPLEGVFGCLAEEQFGCTEFTTCVAAFSDAPAPAAGTMTPGPTAAPSMAGTAATALGTTPSPASGDAAREAGGDSGVSRTMATTTAVTGTAMALAVGLLSLVLTAI